jgi:hypothetical protein
MPVVATGWQTIGFALASAGVAVSIGGLLLVLTRVRLKFLGVNFALGPQLDEVVEQIRRDTEPPQEADPEEREYLLLREYHAQGLGQAKVSFWFSMVFAMLGFALIVYAVLADSFGSYDGSTEVPLIAGGIVDAVAGLFFVQSNRAQSQMREFFDRLRLDRRLKEALRIADSIPDDVLESRLKVLLALELSGGKPTDQQVTALMAVRDELTFPPTA